jgi:hypothetical protein
MIKPAIMAANKIEFEPATSHGKPVTTVKLVSYDYTLYDKTR